MAPDTQSGKALDAEYYWANRMGRMYLQALEDVMGKNGLNAILNSAGLRTRIGNYPANNLDLGWSFREVSAISQALDDQYGRQGGKGIAIRGGRAVLRHRTGRWSPRGSARTSLQPSASWSRPCTTR